MQVVRVSGTIRKSEEEAIRRARLSIRRVERAVGMKAEKKLGKIAGPGTGAAPLRTVARAQQGGVEEDDDVGIGDGIEDSGEMDKDGGD